MAHQENPAIPINLHLAIAEIWNLHGDRPASGSLGNLVDDFLWKRVEHDRPCSRNKLMFRVRSSVATHDCVQGRQMGQSGSVFALGPHSYLVDQGSQLFS